MTTPFAPLLAEALAHAEAQATRARADYEASQAQDRKRRDEARAEILKDLTALHPHLAQYAEYVEVERLDCDGAQYPTAAGLLLRFPDCDLIYLCVHRFTRNNPWQTIPGKEDPFKVYPDTDSWWEENATSHRSLLLAIADAHRRHLISQAQQADATPPTDPAEADITEDYLKTLLALDSAGHPLPLGSALSDHIKGLLRRLSQYELLLMRTPCAERALVSR